MAKKKAVKLNKKNKKEFGEFKKEEDVVYEPCPHCGTKCGTWQDTTEKLHPMGFAMQYESHAERCDECGRNVNAPKSYYKNRKGVIR